MESCGFRLLPISSFTTSPTVSPTQIASLLIRTQPLVQTTFLPGTASSSLENYGALQTNIPLDTTVCTQPYVRLSWPTRVKPPNPVCSSNLSVAMNGTV